MQSDNDYVSIIVGARQLGKSPVTIRKWITHGLRGSDGSRLYLRHRRFGNRILIARDDLMEFGKLSDYLQRTRGSAC